MLIIWEVQPDVVWFWEQTIENCQGCRTQTQLNYTLMNRNTPLLRLIAGR